MPAAAPSVAWRSPSRRTSRSAIASERSACGTAARPAASHVKKKEASQRARSLARHPQSMRAPWQGGHRRRRGRGRPSVAAAARRLDSAAGRGSIPHATTMPSMPHQTLTDSRAIRQLLQRHTRRERERDIESVMMMPRLRHEPRSERERESGAHEQHTNTKRRCSRRLRPFPYSRTLFSCCSPPLALIPSLPPHRTKPPAPAATAARPLHSLSLTYGGQSHGGP